MGAGAFVSNLAKYSEARDWLASWREQYRGNPRLMVQRLERTLPEQEANWRACVGKCSRAELFEYARSVAMLRIALRRSRAEMTEQVRVARLAKIADLKAELHTWENATAKVSSEKLRPALTRIRVEETTYELRRIAEELRK